MKLGEHRKSERLSNDSVFFSEMLVPNGSIRLSPLTSNSRFHLFFIFVLWEEVKSRELAFFIWKLLPDDLLLIRQLRSSSYSAQIKKNTPYAMVVAVLVKFGYGCDKTLHKSNLMRKLSISIDVKLSTRAALKTTKNG